MVSERLTVTVNAITGPAERKLESLKNSVRSLGLAGGGATPGLSAMESGVDSVARSALLGQPILEGLEDEIEDVGDKATTSAAQTGAFTSALSSVSPAASGASVSLGVLSVTFQSLGAAIAVVTAALVGVAAVLASIGAAIGGVVAGGLALAGAFSAIIGTGILQFGKQRGEQNAERLRQVNERIESLEELREEQGRLTDIQKENLQQAKERRDELEDQTGIIGGLESAYADLRAELVPIISDFGEEFAPLIESAIDRLPSLVREVLNAAGGLSQLKDDVAALGSGFADALPGIVEGTVDLAREAMPAFQDFARFLAREGPDAIRLMVQTAKENAPEFTEFLNLFRDALPDLIGFGNFLMGTIVPGISALADVLGPAVDLLKQLGSGFDSFVDAIPDPLLNFLVEAGKFSVGGGLLRGLEVTGDIVGSLGSDISTPFEGTPNRGVGQTRVNRSGAGGSQSIQIQGELVEKDGQVRAMIDERVDLNNRRGARRVSRSSGDPVRRPR